jgi:hypothetical protein
MAVIYLGYLRVWVPVTVGNENSYIAAMPIELLFIEKMITV